MIREELSRYLAAPAEGVRASYIKTHLGPATAGRAWRAFMSAFCNHDISEIAIRYLAPLNQPVSFLDSPYRLYGHVLRVAGRFISLSYLMTPKGEPEQLREIMYYQTPCEYMEYDLTFHCPAMDAVGPTAMSLNLIEIAHSLYRFDNPMLGPKFGKIAHLMAQSHQDTVLYMTVKGMFLTHHNGDYLASVTPLSPLNG